MTLFTDKAPWIMNLLRSDFGLTVEDAAAILGNIGHECNGFKTFQEQAPWAGRGGFGWAQWTGPRRVAFEAYCKRNNLSPTSDKANYGWLWNELKGSEKAAIPALKRASGLEAKVRAFEAKFERAGVKHYESRYVWAERALAAWKASQNATPPYVIEGAQPPPQTPPQPSDGLTDEEDVERPSEAVPPSFWGNPVVWGMGFLAIAVAVKALFF